MDKVKSYIEKNKDRFLNELFELLRIPSISAQSDHKPDMKINCLQKGREVLVCISNDL